MTNRPKIQCADLTSRPPEALPAEGGWSEADRRLAAKLTAYREGRYRLKAPPVCCIDWSPRDWTMYIDRCGEWQCRPRPTATVGCYDCGAEPGELCRDGFGD
jgi:hypothetical protein